MRTATVLLLALFVPPAAAPLSARADDPARPSADALAARLAELRSKRAALEKEEAALIAELRAELKRLADLADKLGLNGPTPPKPVDPPVVPPKPVDPLRAALRAAYDADPAPAKRDAAVLLAALYKEVAALAVKKADGRYEVATGGELRRRMREAGEALVGVSALTDARKLVAAEVGKLLPTDMPLAESDRADVARLFVALSATFEEFAK